MKCPYKMGWGGLDVECDKPEHLPHDTEHQGQYLATKVTWLHSDRRTYQGERDACTKATGCILPGGHPGRCAE